MKPPQIRPLSQQPTYIEASEQINTHAAALAKVQGRIAEIEAMLVARPDAMASESHVDAALEFAATGVVKMPENSITSLTEEHLVLREQRDALQKAIKGRHDALHEIVRGLSQQVTREAATEHRAKAARMLKLLEEMDALFEDELVFIRGLEQAGYDVSFLGYGALLQGPRAA